MTGEFIFWRIKTWHAIRKQNGYKLFMPCLFFVFCRLNGLISRKSRTRVSLRTSVVVSRFLFCVWAQGEGRKRRRLFFSRFSGVLIRFADVGDPVTDIFSLPMDARFKPFDVKPIADVFQPTHVFVPLSVRPRSKLRSSLYRRLFLIMRRPGYSSLRTVSVVIRIIRSSVHESDTRCDVFRVGQYSRVSRYSIFPYDVVPLAPGFRLRTI